MIGDVKADLRNIENYPRAPVKRAAYSDRAARLMAILAELAEPHRLYRKLHRHDRNSQGLIVCRARWYGGPRRALAGRRRKGSAKGARAPAAIRMGTCRET